MVCIKYNNLLYDNKDHVFIIINVFFYSLEWSNISDQSSPMSIGVNEAGLPICKVCGKVFKHQGSLVAHYQVCLFFNY